ncbi:MAG: nucleotide-binding protein [Bacteroidales bacterium]|nr:nucleotide-binding protein [Bacteroidales bacterium]
MEKREDVRTIHLKEHIEKIAQIDNVLEIYLFGSRAFKTMCKTSDIDILIYYRDGIENDELKNIRDAEHALDLFKTQDKHYAESFCNGSHILNDNLIQSLHAKLLWSKEKGYNDEFLNSYGKIDVLRNIDFKMSYCCTYSSEEKKFYSTYGYDAIFVIMPFRDECEPVYNTIKDVFGKHNLKVIRASDKEFKDNLWDNVQIYLDCCRAAVSIFHYDEKKERCFDRLKKLFTTPNKQVFNPNVAIETGYMMAKQEEKDICILKDKRLEKLPTDFLGKLYKEYDINNLDDLKEQLNDWIRDHLNI